MGRQASLKHLKLRLFVANDLVLPGVVFADAQNVVIPRTRSCSDSREAVQNVQDVFTFLLLHGY